MAAMETETPEEEAKEEEEERTFPVMELAQQACRRYKARPQARGAFGGNCDGPIQTHRAGAIESSDICVALRSVWPNAQRVQ